MASRRQRIGIWAVASCCVLACVWIWLSIDSRGESASPRAELSGAKVRAESEPNSPPLELEAIPLESKEHRDELSEVFETEAHDAHASVAVAAEPTVYTIEVTTESGELPGPGVHVELECTRTHLPLDDVWRARGAQIAGRWVYSIEVRVPARSPPVWVTLRPMGAVKHRLEPREFELSARHPRQDVLYRDLAGEFRVKWSVSPEVEGDRGVVYLDFGWGGSADTFAPTEEKPKRIARSIDRDSRWMVHMPGYAPAIGSLYELLELSENGEKVVEAPVELRPGWGGRLMVRTRDRRSCEGWPVVVDGGHAAFLDATGSCWLVRSSIPESIEIGVDGGRKWQPTLVDPLTRDGAFTAIVE